MPGSTLFADAMALTPAGDGVYHGELNEHWTIGSKVHGGAMLALCANAALKEHGEHGVQPIAVAGNFLWPLTPARCGWWPLCASGGRRVSRVDVELRQGARTGDVGAPPACGGRSRE